MSIFGKIMAYDRLRNNYMQALHDLSSLAEQNEKIKEQNKELVDSNLSLIREMNKIQREVARC